MMGDVLLVMAKEPQIFWGGGEYARYLHSELSSLPNDMVGACSVRADASSLKHTNCAVKDCETW